MSSQSGDAAFDSFSPTFDEIVAAITSGRYVTWAGKWSCGTVLSAWTDTDGEQWLGMQSTNPAYKPFRSGYAQANILGQVLTIRGNDVDDWAR